MTESEYWIDLSNRASNHMADIHQSEMSAAVQREEFNLFNLLKPTLMVDGNQFEVLYGPNPMEGVAGYGNTPYLAVLDFNKNWHQNIATNGQTTTAQGDEG